eukprot:m.35133 g.35133  ORF g.35133 m.35133 type:complete len:79 (-) comp9990_c0_seq4:84-320(-)
MLMVMILLSNEFLYESFGRVISCFLVSLLQAHIDLPCDPSADVEFAVCFKANDGNEYWDNNMGENHHIVKGEEVNPAY